MSQNFEYNNPDGIDDEPRRDPPSIGSKTYRRLAGRDDSRSCLECGFFGGLDLWLTADATIFSGQCPHCGATYEQDELREMGPSPTPSAHPSQQSPADLPRAVFFER